MLDQCPPRNDCQAACLIRDRYLHYPGQACNRGRWSYRTGHCGSSVRNHHLSPVHCYSVTSTRVDPTSRRAKEMGTTFRASIWYPLAIGYRRASDLHVGMGLPPAIHGRIDADCGLARRAENSVRQWRLKIVLPRGRTKAITSPSRELETPLVV